MIRFFSLLLFLGLVFGQDKGKTAYEDGKFDEARAYYEHILKNRKKDGAAQFSLGATAYQQKDMETAARSLNNVMNSKDKSLASKAMYNLGNMFRDQQKMEESLAFYRKAIELDPTDEDAKVNYELLKQVLQQQQQQEKDSDKDQNQEKQDQQKQDQNSEYQDEQNQNKDQDKDKKEQDQQQSQSNEEKKEQKQQQTQAKQDESQDEKTDKQMQAEAILNALKDQEKINQKRQIAKSKSRKLEKDW